MRLLTCLFLTASLLLSAQPASATASASPDTIPAPAREGVWPLSPRPDVLSGFDPPSTTWGPGHRGVDLLGHAGQPVHASLGGTVTFAARLAGRGVLVVDHGAARTTYEPVSASVHTGDVVSRGQVIGTLQLASSHCFPRACLHWGLRRGEAYLDPLTLLGAGPVRLLPLEASLGTGLSPTPWWDRPVSTVPRHPALRPGDAPVGRPDAAGPW